MRSANFVNYSTHARRIICENNAPVPQSIKSLACLKEKAFIFFFLRLTDIAYEGTRFELLKKLIYSWPVFTLRSLLGALLVYFMDVGLL